MPRLIASDLDRREEPRRQWSLEDGVSLPLGSRVARDQLLIEWDEQIAPRHALLRWQDERLFVDRSSEAPPDQPIFYAGREAASFQIVPGEGFVIGGTAFRLALREADTSAPTNSSPVHTIVYTAEQLRSMEFNPTEAQLAAICELLAYFDSPRVDLDKFLADVVEKLAAVIGSARYVAVLDVNVREREVAARTRFASAPGICDELVFQACEKQEIVSTAWKAGAKKPDFLPLAGVGWACCAPVMGSKETEGDMALYLSGAPSAGAGRFEHMLAKDQLLFVGIVAWILNGVRMIHDLKRSQVSMQEFFPAPIRNLLQQRGPEDVFRTEQAHAAVLFCDLRGSCQFAERGAGQLMQSWDRLQIALSVMTEAIAKQSGTIGDFQGDAAMGFWGWPGATSAARDLTESVRSACKAANVLRDDLRKRARPGGPLEGFACGIGIAAGDVVAGMLGTEDQRKISVFGPVVNLAARLESMTKQVGASILLDATANTLLVSSETVLARRTRYLAKVRPAGMDQAIEIFELMPSEADPLRLPLAKLRLFEHGQQAFQRGEWEEARKSLERVPADGPSKFLLDFMAEHQSPPAGWDGTIRLQRK